MTTKRAFDSMILGCALLLAACPPSDPPNGHCEPECDEAECGEDGCGGSCGECDSPFVCEWWSCVCPPETHGCGESCCTAGQVCVDGSCCDRSCEGRDCGDDGCGGTCGPGCSFGEVCGEGGVCSSAWIRVDAGSFVMGSPAGEHGRAENESAHAVTLTRAFEIFATEVTRADFELVLGYEPAALEECGSSCPATFVTWHEAAAFCNALSEAEGLPTCYDCTGEGSRVECEPAAEHGTPYDCDGYRLPTEAEWERAARAGSDEATYNGDLDADELGCESPNATLDSIAWFCGNSDGAEHPVGALEPNDLGIYDLLGNVGEWCHDRCPMLHFECSDYESGAATDPFGADEGTYRVVRGGSWSSEAADVRAAFRTGAEPDHDAAVWGFRPARTAP